MKKKHFIIIFAIWLTPLFAQQKKAEYKIANKCEPIPYLINTCDEALEYIDAVGSRNLKILLDTFHMNIEEDSFSHAIKKAGQKLGHFHPGETNRRAPGQGRMPWDEIFRALNEINYTGTTLWSHL